MKTDEIVRELLSRSDMSMRSISLALGKADNWARLTAKKSRNPRIDTIATIADLTGVDVCLVDRSTGQTLGVVEPPRQGDDSTKAAK